MPHILNPDNVPTAVTNLMGKIERAKIVIEGFEHQQRQGAQNLEYLREKLADMERQLREMKT